MPSPWRLVHPRFAFLLPAHKPLRVVVENQDYCLPHHLKQILKVGIKIRLLFWAGTEEIRAVWVAR